MKKERFNSSAVLLTAAAFGLTALNLIFYGGGWKVMTLLLCLSAVAVCVVFRRRLSRFASPAAALAMYVVFSAVSGFGAVSEKFFLKEYCKLLMAFCLYLGVLICGNRDKAPVRISLILTAMAAICCGVSVELASTGLLKGVLTALTGYGGMFTGFEKGVRLTGLFGNANALASVAALGCFLSLSLMESEHPLWGSITMGICSFAFILAFSLGGIVFLATAAVVYLIAAGDGRVSALCRMLEAAVSSAAFAALSFPFFESPIPLLAMAVNCEAVYLLEIKLHPKFTALCEGRKRLLFIGLPTLLALYLVLAFFITGGYTYRVNGILRRAVYPGSGEHIITVNADGYIGVAVRSQSRDQVLTQTSDTVLYDWTWTGDENTFTVPDGSQVVYISLWGREGTRLNSVLLDGKPIKLDYKLIPDFAANRLQGVFVNQNAFQRTVFFRDGMKLFSESPVLGCGMGSFESSACRVQSYYYETKYVHNQYIQVLIDGGVVGLAAYLGFLLATLLTLWRSRKKGGALYPALWACMVMALGHSSMDVIMSMSVYLPFIFPIFALICLEYGSPVKPAKILYWLSCLPTAVFALLITLNLSANAMTDDQSLDYSGFMSALESAASMDVFDRNDYMVSYVWNSTGSQSPYVLDKAEQYARELSSVRSNSITGILLQYRLNTGSFDEALDLALFGAFNNRSNPDLWNDYLGYISAALPAESLTDTQLQKVTVLLDALEKANKELLVPVTLTDENQTYAQAVLALGQKG